MSKCLRKCVLTCVHAGASSKRIITVAHSNSTHTKEAKKEDNQVETQGNLLGEPRATYRSSKKEGESKTVGVEGRSYSETE